MSNKQTFKAGVLIIGSLYWDFSNGRPSWREQYFGENFHHYGIKVSVPIRYGRFSSSRACPTMVLSSKYENEGKTGQAILLPFYNQKQSIDDIICSAKSLSEAEGNGSRDFVKGGKDKWCVITFKANPAIVESEVYSEFTEKWITQYHSKLSTIQDQFKCNCETQAVFDSSGSLDIRWPENLTDFDVILATQTKPTDCFSIESMASAFYNKPEYFIKNRLNEIYTADDEQVLIELRDLVNNDQKLFEKNAVADGCSPNEISNFIRSTMNLK